MMRKVLLACLDAEGTAGDFAGWVGGQNANDLEPRRVGERSEDRDQFQVLAVGVKDRFVVRVDDRKTRFGWCNYSKRMVVLTYVTPFSLEAFRLP